MKTDKLKKFMIIFAVCVFTALFLGIAALINHGLKEKKKTQALERKAVKQEIDERSRRIQRR